MTPLRWLKDRLKRRLGVPTIEFALAALRDNGFSPAVVFDVGAHVGEFAKFCRRLYHPKPVVYCFEPLEECAPSLTALQLRGEVVYLAGLVGATDAESVRFHEAGTASSVLAAHASAAPPTINITCKPVSRLDTLIDLGKCRVPDLLKIDTQGYELDVLKGFERNLLGVQVILAELNLIDIYAEVPLAHQVINWLADHGFVLYDIASLIRRPLDGVLWQADFLFVQVNGSFRSDKRWGRQ